MSARVVIDYTNYRGERGKRNITPEQIFWAEEHPYHPSSWILRAFDHHRQNMRDFALRDIHSWEDTPDPEAR